MKVQVNNYFIGKSWKSRLSKHNQDNPSVPYYVLSDELVTEKTAVLLCLSW